MANNWFTYNGKVIFFNGKSITNSSESTIPDNTLRFKFSDTSYVPTVGSSSCTAKTGFWTAYDASAGIWDWSAHDTWFGAFYKRLTDSVLGTGNTAELISCGDNMKVSTMTNLFNGCTNLTSVSLSGTSTVDDMNSMFRDCTSLTRVSLFNTSVATDMGGLFNGCTSLTSVSLPNTSTVENMKGMFGGCSSLVNAPLLDTSSATDMFAMFFKCSSLKSVPLLDTSSVTNMESMFHACYNVESGALALYQQASSQATPPSNHTKTFLNCGRDTTTGAAELAQIPSDWK